MFKTTRGKIRGVYCSVILLSGLSFGINTVFGDKDASEASGFEAEAKNEVVEVEVQVVGTYMNTIELAGGGSHQVPMATVLYKDTTHDVQINHGEYTSLEQGDVIVKHYYTALAEVK